MAVALETVNIDTKAIPLRPFRDQVGGNFMILEINDQYICKPLQARETMFYETLPDKLKRFTPEYKGMLSVSFSREENGGFSYIGYPVKQNGTLSKEAMDQLEVDNLRYLRISRRNVEAKGVTTVPLQDAVDGRNPWIDFRVKTTDSILELREDVNKQFKYIILENLTSRFTNPCVMDLKLGTRTHTDEMSERKKQVHLKKCDETTSKSLAIRLAGLQVYRIIDGKYHYMDKFDGSTLTADRLVEILIDFLFNGVNYNIKLMLQLIEKLKHLLEIIKQLDSYRLYSSSLLIMYEGSTLPSLQSNGITAHKHHDPLDTTHDRSDTTHDLLDPNKPSEVIDIRMIDFGNATNPCDPVKYDGPDDGYILGLTNIINVYENFLKKC